MSIFTNIMDDKDFDSLNEMVRWNGVKRIKDESVAHHSFIVAWFTRILVEEIFKIHTESDKIINEITTYAIFHDFDEMFTGDIIHNLKYNALNGKELRLELKKYCEFSAKAKFGSKTTIDDMFLKYILPKFPNYYKSIVKVADWLAMIFYTNKEINLGNVEMKKNHNYACGKLIDECVLAKIYLLEAIENENINLRIKIIDDLINSNFKK